MEDNELMKLISLRNSQPEGILRDELTAKINEIQKPVIEMLNKTQSNACRNNN